VLPAATPRLLSFRRGVVSARCRFGAVSFRRGVVSARCRFGADTRCSDAAQIFAVLRPFLNESVSPALRIRATQLVCPVLFGGVAVDRTSVRRLLRLAMPGGVSARAGSSTPVPRQSWPLEVPGGALDYDAVASPAMSCHVWLSQLSQLALVVSCAVAVSQPVVAARGVGGKAPAPQPVSVRFWRGDELAQVTLAGPAAAAAVEELKPDLAALVSQWLDVCVTGCAGVLDPRQDACTDTVVADTWPLCALAVARVAASELGVAPAVLLTLWDALLAVLHDAPPAHTARYAAANALCALLSSKPVFLDRMDSAQLSSTLDRLGGTLVMLQQLALTSTSAALSSTLRDMLRPMLVVMAQSLADPGGKLFAAASRLSGVGFVAPLLQLAALDLSAANGAADAVVPAAACVRAVAVVMRTVLGSLSASDRETATSVWTAAVCDAVRGASSALLHVTRLSADGAAPADAVLAAATAAVELAAVAPAVDAWLHSARTAADAVVAAVLPATDDSGAAASLLAVLDVARALRFAGVCASRLYDASPSVGTHVHDALVAVVPAVLGGAGSAVACTGALAYVVATTEEAATSAVAMSVVSHAVGSVAAVLASSDLQRLVHDRARAALPASGASVALAAGALSVLARVFGLVASLDTTGTGDRVAALVPVIIASAAPYLGDDVHPPVATVAGQMCLDIASKAMNAFKASLQTFDDATKQVCGSCWRCCRVWPWASVVTDVAVCACVALAEARGGLACRHGTSTRWRYQCCLRACTSHRCGGGRPGTAIRAVATHAGRVAVQEVTPRCDTNACNNRYITCP
jgi:hypothetical protein